MSDDDWVPFGLTDEEVDQYRVLAPGVPDWMREPLISWICARLRTNTNNVPPDSVIAIQAVTRVQLGWYHGIGYVGTATFAEQLRRIDGIQLLRIADFLISQRGSSGQHALERVLSAAGSKYTVGTRAGRNGLVERVPEGVQVSVEGVITTAGSAGAILARAWGHVHGLEPNDSSAYHDAVRAVETAAQPVVEPDNDRATLGTIIRRLRQDGDWRLPLREHEHTPGPQFVIDSCRTLWEGHRDRHGSSDYSDVTHDEARAAVALAATLVDWFSSGAVQRRTSV